MENGRSDDHKDEKSQKFGGNRITVFLLGGLADVAAFGDVFGVLLVRLAHAGCGRHLGLSKLIEVIKKIIPTNPIHYP